MALAERLAGPVQTMMRTEAELPELHEMLIRVAPDVVTRRLAGDIHASMRSLTGHWGSTRCGDAMELRWPADATTRTGS